jgi:hypothetical protein
MRMNVPRSGRGRLLRVAIGVATVLAPAAVAGGASAAQIAPTAACYVNVGLHEPQVTIVGRGFAPGDDIAVNGNGFFAHGAAGADGTIIIKGEGPALGTIDPVVKTYTLEAQDESAGSTILATTTIHVTNFTVSLSPTSVKNVHRDRVHYRFSGFIPGRHIYAYFRRKTTLARFTFGKAQRPCGTASAKALLYPGGHPGHDKYTVTFEQTSRYTKKALRYVSTLDLFGF